MKTLLVIAALCLPVYAQVPQIANTVLIGTEGITVTAISSPTAVLVFGAGTTWNTITAPKLPLIITCSGGCPLLGGDPVPFVTKSLYAQQQATAYTVTYSLNGVKTVKTIPALPPPPSTTYALNCTVAVPASGPMPTTLPLTGCTLVKRPPAISANEVSPKLFGVPQGETPTPKITRSFDGCNTTTYTSGAASSTTLGYCAPSTELSRLLGAGVKQ